MTICYIPAVSSLSDLEQGWLEQVISKSIQSTIVDPFCKWCNGLWIKFIDVSYIFCLAIAISGALMGICGIKKGYKYSIFSILFYLLLRLVSWAYGWY